MSNAEKVVSVPYTLAQRLCKNYTGRPNWDALEDDRLAAVVELREVLSKPADQHQGEPVALKCWSCKADLSLADRSNCDGCCWKCGVEIDLDEYVEKFAGEVERLRTELSEQREIFAMQEDKIDGLRAKLADRDAQRSFANEIISAAYEGGSFEGGDIQDVAVKHGLLRIESRAEECGEACACREYGFPAECYRKTALLSASAEPSAQVEIDERADFEAHYLVDLAFEEADFHMDGERYVWQATQDRWEAWQARAALERKP